MSRPRKSVPRARAGSARGGRFAVRADPRLNALNRSVGFDLRLAPDDLAGSAAWADVLAAAGVLSAGDHRALRRGLRAIAREFARGAFRVAAADEDVHMAIERRLGELIGPAAGTLHTGRSRNDQVATDTRLFLRRHLDRTLADLLALVGRLAGEARAHPRAVLPAYTHLQPAQPVLLAHHLLAYAEMLLRDFDRLRDARVRVNLLPLGAAACTGTTLAIDRRALAAALGFAGVLANSMDAVSARDYLLEFFAAAAVLGLHLSRLAEEMILWSAAEFGFVRFSDRVTTGSSIMPQKRNLDGAELVRGKTGRLLGHFVTLATALKGLPLAYMKDLQEDKEPLFDAVDTLALIVPATTLMLEEWTVDEAAMRRAAERPASYLLATELADYLAAQGVPFRQAHHAVGALVARCAAAGRGLADLTPAELQAAHPAFADDVFRWLTVAHALARRDVPGGTAPRRVRQALRALDARLARRTAWRAAQAAADPVRRP